MQDYGYNISKLVKDMECYAKKENIPIMLEDGIEYLLSFIKENNIKSVLEVGTAIGYSAIRIAYTGASVLSIERDKERYLKAVENVKNANLSEKIELINEDALEVDVKGLYDLVFIDAAKSQNLKFVNKFKNNLSKDGYILIDNVDFHGLVGHSSEIKSRNLRGLVRKIESFLDYLDKQEEFSVLKVDKGDGLIILRKRV